MEAYATVYKFLTENWATGKPSPERHEAIKALDSIRAEARAEALREAADSACEFISQHWDDAKPSHFDRLCDAILSDEPKDMPKCTRPLDMECHAHSGDNCYNGFQCDPISDEPKEREAEVMPAFKVYKDGSKFCAVTGGFLNLQESESGWGDTPVQALSDLIKTPSIDLDAIRAEARAEALKEAAVAISGMNQMAPSALNDDYLIGYGFGIRDCQIKIESILANEPKEREAEDGK